jgi:transposase
MRGNEDRQEEVFSYIPLEKRVPGKHPLRKIREITDRALLELSAWFDELYSKTGRPSIPPEQLLRALVLQVLYTMRSERQLMDQIDGSWRYRWFVGLKVDETVWDATVFTKNRERLMAGEIAQKFFDRVLEQASKAGLLEDEHFTVDGTVIEAWASRNSMEKKKDPPQRGTGARGRKMFRDLYESKTDPEARMYRKGYGNPAKPSYMGHVVIENKNGLIMQSCVSQAMTKAERESGLGMMSRLLHHGGTMTLGADRAYQEEKFVKGLRALGVIPLIAEYKKSKNWPNWLEPSEREHPRFAWAQKKRRLVEKVFSWIKNVAGLRRTKFRGCRRVDWIFRLAAAAHNLIRMAKLIPAV